MPLSYPFLRKVASGSQIALRNLYFKATVLGLFRHGAWSIVNFLLNQRYEEAKIN